MKTDLRADCAGPFAEFALDAPPRARGHILIILQSCSVVKWQPGLVPSLSLARKLLQVLDL